MVRWWEPAQAAEAEGRPRRRLYRITDAGAVSGGTAVLAVYPHDQVSVAVVANLGHASFPGGRLFGILNPFLGDPAKPVAVAWVAVVGSVAAVMAVGGVRRRRARRAGQRNPDPPSDSTL